MTGIIKSNRNKKYLFNLNFMVFELDRKSRAVNILHENDPTNHKFKKKII